MIPDTKNGLPAMACISAMQKAIRRSMEREAMEFACELIHTGKAFHTMVCNRLEVICHERRLRKIPHVAQKLPSSCRNISAGWAIGSLQHTIKIAPAPASPIFC